MALGFVGDHLLRVCLEFQKIELLAFDSVGPFETVTFKGLGDGSAIRIICNSFR